MLNSKTYLFVSFFVQNTEFIFPKWFLYTSVLFPVIFCLSHVVFMKRMSNPFLPLLFHFCSGHLSSKGEQNRMLHRNQALTVYLTFHFVSSRKWFLLETLNGLGTVTNCKMEQVQAWVQNSVQNRYWSSAIESLPWIPVRILIFDLGIGWWSCQRGKTWKGRV